MKKIPVLFMLAFPFFVLSGCDDHSTPSESGIPTDQQQLARQSDGEGNIVVANRASGSISVINTATDELTGTYQLPANPNPPEPMYVVFVQQSRRVFVGDRANDQIVVFRASEFTIETTIPVGSGVFHMWADPEGRQLWVNNDIDKTTSVVDLTSLQSMATVPTPADLVDMGGIPHDVILDPSGERAFVTVLGLSGPSDYVVQYSTETFQETGRAEVGKDPHLSITERNGLLYVPCQGSNAVYLLDRSTMDEVEVLDITGAHGAGMTNGSIFYTSNLSSLGLNGLYAINTMDNTIIGSANTPYAAPHNMVVAGSLGKMYLTHSEATGNKVTVYAVSNENPIPQLLTEIDVELNPFGIAYSK
jgi:DNA-binding beta-propeller fold protein YncE